MSKNLSKVKTGDFVRAKGDGDCGIVIKDSIGRLILLFRTGFNEFSLSSRYCKERVDYRRLHNPRCLDYNIHNWKESFKKAEPLFPESEIEITVKINGQESNLSDISEETLMKIRNQN